MTNEERLLDENRLLKQEIERLRQENEALRSDLYKLSLLQRSASKGVASSVDAILEEADRLRQEVEGLRAELRRVSDFLPMFTITAAGADLLLRDGSGQPLNLLVGATIIARDNADPMASFTVFPLDNLVYSGTLRQFEADALIQIGLLLSGLPSHADLAGAIPEGLNVREIGRIFADLAEARLISHDEYKRRRKAHFDAYWPMVEHSQSPYSKTKDEARTAFDRFWDRSFKHSETRTSQTAARLKGIPKSVMDSSEEGS